MSEPTDLDPIEPLTDPQDAPPVHTAEDVRRRWRSLMGPDGFGRESLWATWYDPEGFQAPLVMPVDDLPARLDRQFLDALVQVLNTPAEQGAATVALALSRPGSAAVNDTDRHRALSILGALESARTDGRFALRWWPLCLATQNAVRTLAPDDLE